MRKIAWVVMVVVVVVDQSWATAVAERGRAVKGANTVHGLVTTSS